MAKLTVNNFNDLDASVSYANNLRQERTVSEIKDSVQVTQDLTSNKSISDINQSIAFSDDLRKLKTPNQVKEGIDKADKSIESVINITALRNITPDYDGQQFNVLGHTEVGIGGGVFYYDESDTTSGDDNGMVIVGINGQRFKRKNTVRMTPAMFGEIADWNKENNTGTDNYDAYNNAVNAISSLESGGTLFVPNGKRGISNSINVPRGVNIEFESPSSRIFYNGDGYCFNFIASDHTDISKYYKFISVLNGRIEDASEGSADGALNFNGAYLVNVTGEIFGFEKSGAKGCTARNVFNFTYEKGLINSISNGTGLSIEGDSDGIQVTNVKIGDNLLIQRCNQDIEISTEKQAQAIEISNMALQHSDDATGIVISGNVGNIKIGPAIHAECYADTNASNLSKFLQIKPSAQVRTLEINGVDLYNIKEYFDLDASGSAVINDVSIDNIYSAAGVVNTGKAFTLKGIGGDISIGKHNIDGSKYNLFDISDCNPVFDPQSILSTSLPSNSGWKGLIAFLKDKTIGNDRDFMRVFDGAQWYRFIMASASGVIRATGDIQWADQRRIAIIDNSPEGNLSANNGSLALENNGRVWKKESGGYTSTGWVELVSFKSATVAELSDVTNEINTIGKYTGRMVFDSDNGYYVYASAPTASASWNKLSTDSAIITPT